jgi:mRNA-degrading endonuclease RelE of RelBE toxin-antitoxin system
LVFTTSIFLSEIALLSKKKKNGYSNCINDVKHIICGQSFIDICNLDDTLTRTDSYIIRKVRIPNSEKAWGKSSGYRLILLCNTKKNEAYLLTVYPKKGNLAASDLTADGLNILLDQFGEMLNEEEVFETLCAE